MRSTAGLATGVESTSVLVTTVFGLAAPRRRRTFIFAGGVDNAASAASAATAGAADEEPLTKVNRLNTLPVSTIIGVRSGSAGPAHEFFCAKTVASLPSRQFSPAEVLRTEAAAERACGAHRSASGGGRSAQRANLALVRAALRDPPALRNPPREK